MGLSWPINRSTEPAEENDNIGVLLPSCCVWKDVYIDHLCTSRPDTNGLTQRLRWPTFIDHDKPR